MSDVTKMTNEQLLDEFGPDSLTGYGRELRAELLRRLNASQTPAAPQVDVEGLARTIIERVAKDAVMLAIVRWSLEWDKDALEMTDEDIAKDAVDCCTGDEMGCLDEAEATPENCTHVFVAEQLRKHLPPAAAPVGQPQDVSPEKLRQCAEGIVAHADNCDGQIGVDSVIGIIEDHLFPAPPSAHPGEDGR